MNRVNAPGHVSGLPAKPEAAPIVFVVDDDISVRESLEALIRDEGGAMVTILFRAWC